MPELDSQLKIGFVPLTDSAPLVIAREKGFFEKHGLNVSLSRENSWSQIRDKLALGEVDAAHMLAPMVPASWLDKSYTDEKFVTAVSLNLNGNAITVSNALYDEMYALDAEGLTERPISARALKKVIIKRLENNEPAPVIGSVFPYSAHHYALRYWLGAEGINPDRDVRMVVAAPPFMVQQLEDGMVDMFCVGEPWNSVAEHKGVGRAIVTSAEVWRHMPEKVLGVRHQWAEDNQHIHLKLVSAVLEAARWLDERAHRREAAYILSGPDYVNVSPAVLEPALTGQGVIEGRRSLLEGDDVLIFHHYTANFPWRSHALWYLSQMIRWGQIDAPTQVEQIANACYRPDVFRMAAKHLDVPYPLVDTKSEGHIDRAWILDDANVPIAMPRSDFIDGGQFNPDQITQYIEKFYRHNLRTDLSTLIAR